MEKCIFKKYTQLVAGCIVLPDVTVNEGVSVGAFGFVNRNLDEWIIYKGIPAKPYAERKKGLLEKGIKNKIMKSVCLFENLNSLH